MGSAFWAAIGTCEGYVRQGSTSTDSQDTVNDSDLNPVCDVNNSLRDQNRKRANIFFLECKANLQKISYSISRENKQHPYNS